jgi:hypothetical protein
MAVLGLVIERPNETVQWYANALSQRFTRARFGKSTAYNSLRQMAAGNSPRVQRTHAAGGQDGSKDRYEAMPVGLDAFQSWMFQPPTASPAVRQALYGRIGLARLEDLPGLIGVVREEEAIATHLYEQANNELREHEVRKRNRSGVGKTRADFEREIHETWLYVGPLHWSSRATLCLMAIDRLEEIAQDAGVAVENAPDQADPEHPQAPAG